MSRVNWFRVVINSMSFKTKLMASYLLVFVIPTIFAALYAYFSIAGRARDAAISDVNEYLTIQARTIENRFESAETVAEYISRSEALFRWFYLNLYTDAEYVLEVLGNVEPLLTLLHDSLPSIAAMNFYTYNERVIKGTFFYDATPFEGEPWFENLRARVTDAPSIWTGSHPTRAYDYLVTPGTEVISLGQPLAPSSSEDATYFEIEVYPELIFALPGEFLAGFSGFTSVLGENGEIFAITGFEHNIEVAREVLNTIIQELGENLHAASNFPFGKYEVTVAPLNRLGAVLINATLESTLVGTIPRATTLLSAVFLAGLTALFLLSLFLASLLMRRIRQMVFAIRKIHDGDFDIALPVVGKDEIDELAADINRMSAKIHELITVVYESRLAQKETEFDALHAQINPHFIFNVLETLKMLAELHDEDEIAGYLTSLGHILRYNTALNVHFTTVAHEIAVIEDYVAIQNLLFDDRIHLEFDVPPEFFDLEIPNFILQPIVENSVIHALSPDERILNISTSVSRGEGEFILEVSDDGIGIDPGDVESINNSLQIADVDVQPDAKNGTGVGLANISKRIRLYYGTSYGLSIALNDVGGVRTCIRLSSDKRISRTLEPVEHL